MGTSDKRRNIYFLSDLHLGSRSLSDALKSEKKVVAFLDSIKEDAKEIFLVGDILDYWFEYKHVVPRGFVRFFGKIAELTDSGVKITWLTGNHDIWIFDYLPKELGIELVNGAILRKFAGKTFFIEHGDGVGYRPRKERVMRAVFRSRFCQKLFSGIHPRWTVPFAFGWSHSNRKKHYEVPPYMGRDKEPLMVFAREYLISNSVDYFIFGHRHLLVEETIEAENTKRNAKAVILGDWIEKCSYAVFDGSDLFLRRFDF